MLTLLVACCVNGQGTFIYDQQSSTDEAPPFGYGEGFQVPGFPNLGDGQTFTPSLSSVGFIRLMFDDLDPNDGAGATVYVNLLTGVSGSVIGKTAPITMFNGFKGPQTFLFSNPISVTPGTQYYFEAVEQSGGSGGWGVIVGQYPYSAGSAYLNGSPNLPQDYWFREGIIVPEPSSLALLVIGGCSLLWFKNRKKPDAG